MSTLENKDKYIKNALFRYDEFWPGNGLPSLKSKINREIQHKGEVLNYLKSGKYLAGMPKVIYDVFDGSAISCPSYYGDGEYVWSNEFIYYVEKYNLEVPEYFIEHVLRELKKHKVVQYCEILTKDGYKGHIVEIFDAEKGDYLADIDYPEPKGTETVDITIDEIEKVIVAE